MQEEGKKKKKKKKIMKMRRRIGREKILLFGGPVRSVESDCVGVWAME